MLITGLILAAFAALLHVYIFVLESVTWTSERTRAVFGTTEHEAAVTAPLAFNQGFYNLFLAVQAGIGIALVAAGQNGVGLALVLAGVGSMLAAALVLALSSPDKATAALRQGVFPAFAVAILLLSFIL